MRQPISWSALADTSGRVGVWGLGVEGGASLRRLRAMGHVPVLVDDKPGAPTLDGIEVLATDRGGLDALMACEVVVKSPGISRYRPEVAELEAAAVAVCGGLGLFMAEADLDRVVCVTGTKGKSTTTVLAVHLLARPRRARPEAGGNIGRPPWDLVGRTGSGLLGDRDVELPGPGPAGGIPVVAVTSLGARPPRLARDGGALLRRQALALHQTGRRAGTGQRNRRTVAGRGGCAWVRTSAGSPMPTVTTTPSWSDELGLRGRHNAAQRHAVPPDPAGARDPRCRRRPEAAQAAAGFAGYPAAAGRWAPSVRSSSSTTASRPTSCPPKPPWTPSTRCRWRSWWADTTAASTTRRSGRRVARRARADARGHHARQRAPHRRRRPRRGDNGRSDRRRSLEEAVATAYRWASRPCRARARRPPGSTEGKAVVLLSPAAPSFGRFSDYRERAAAFTDAAGRCGRLDGEG